MTDRNSAIRLKEHHNSTVPILYSFRRCPYAMRARWALLEAGLLHAERLEDAELLEAELLHAERLKDAELLEAELLRAERLEGAELLKEQLLLVERLEDLMLLGAEVVVVDVTFLFVIPTTTPTSMLFHWKYEHLPPQR